MRLSGFVTYSPREFQETRRDAEYLLSFVQVHFILRVGFEFRRLPPPHQPYHPAPEVCRPTCTSVTSGRGTSRGWRGRRREPPMRPLTYRKLQFARLPLWWRSPRSTRPLDEEQQKVADPQQHHSSPSALQPATLASAL